MEVKTNVMRILEKQKLGYKHYCYVETGATNGEEVAALLGEDPLRVFKTLVTVAKSASKYVFMVPVCVGEKSVEMLKSKELLPLTGYVHGGCSPIGMKKFFPTVIDSSAADYDTIIFSAGKIGYQVELSPADLAQVICYAFADITV